MSFRNAHAEVVEVQRCLGHTCRRACSRPAATTRRAREGLRPGSIPSGNGCSPKRSSPRLPRGRCAACWSASHRFDAPPDTLVDAIEPDDVLRVPVVSVHEGTVGDPIRCLERLSPCQEETATVKSSGLNKINHELNLRRWPDPVIRVPLPLRSQAHHRASRASARSRTTRHNAVQRNAFEVALV